MRFKLFAAGWIGFALLLPLLCGCGSSVYPVTGKITFEGKPMVGGGSIAFQPIGGQKGKAAGGEIMADGTYKLSTYGDGDGSMTGEFRVVITQSTVKEPEPTPDGQKPNDPVIVAEVNRIPVIYATYQSPLKATVEAKSLNEINFDLKRSDQPKQGAPGGGA
jgi:hypothetical protein